MRKHIIILLGIILLAATLRFSHISKVPPSLYWDEVSQGYNAYSMLKTGKDEHQEFMPLARFQAFGDYKAPINIYLTVPSIALFGKTEFAVRFPSALLGTLTVAVTYFLIVFLFINHKHKETMGLVGALLLAISPWHIQLSRAAFEGNVATFFTVMAVSLFLIAIHKRPWILIGSSISFAFAFYSFNAHRVFIPLFVILLGVIYWRDLLRFKKQIIASVVVGVIIMLPFLTYLRTPESRLRFNEVNIFTDIEVVEKANELISEENSILGKVFHNRRVLYAREYIRNYFDFFNPTYLFISGDINPRFSDRFNGQLFLWMIPLLVIGAYSLFKERSKSSLVVLGWLLLAPLAAATARETPHALRSETFIPIFEIIAGAGAILGWMWLRQQRRVLLPVVYLACLGIVSLSVYSFWHNYIKHNPVLYSTDWQYGYKEAIAFLKPLEDSTDVIYFTNYYGRPSIYVAWYGDVTPQEYWQKADVQKDTVGFYNVQSLGIYQFVETVPQDAKPNSLIVMPKDRVPNNVSVLKEISFLNGDTAFVIARMNQ